MTIFTFQTILKSRIARTIAPSDIHLLKNYFHFARITFIKVEDNQTLLNGKQKGNNLIVTRRTYLDP